MKFFAERLFEIWPKLIEIIMADKRVSIFLICLSLVILFFLSSKLEDKKSMEE